MTWTFLPAKHLQQHAQEWDAWQAASTNTPFFETLFLVPLLDVFGRGDELLAFHRSNGQVDAATIVRPVGRMRWELFMPSQLPLGPWVCKPGDGAVQLADSLLRALPGLGLSLGLPQVDPRLVERPAHTDKTHVMDYIDTSFIDIEGSFDAYWDARGKNLRQNTRKQFNKLQSEGTAVSLDTVRDAAGVAEAMVHYGSLEGAGWKAESGTAILPDNDQGRFYRAMLENFCRAGRGRIVRYRFGEQVVAMDLCIDNGPMAVVLKTAYDESFRTVSPSTLMRHEEFRQWWEEGRFQRIEFYGKTMEWHTRWTEAQRRIFHFTAFRWAWLGKWRSRVKADKAAAETTQAGG